MNRTSGMWLALGLSIALNGCGRAAQDDPPQATPSPAPTMVAGQLVHYPKGNQVACATRMALEEFLDHAMRHEVLKDVAMMAENKPGAPCITLTGKMHLEIVSTGTVQPGGLSPGAPALELVPAMSGESNGVWALADSASLGAPPP